MIRFRANPLVRYLLDAGGLTMNHLAALPGIDAEDRAQFAQLIGYSVSGFGDLSYVSGELFAQADEEVVALKLRYPTDPKRSVRTRPPPASHEPGKETDKDPPF